MSTCLLDMRMLCGTPCVRRALGISAHIPIVRLARRAWGPSCRWTGRNRSLGGRESWKKQRKSVWKPLCPPESWGRLCRRCLRRTRMRSRLMMFMLWSGKADGKASGASAACRRQCLLWNLRNSCGNGWGWTGYGLWAMGRRWSGAWGFVQALAWSF